ncbi:phosphoglucosamine mutase [Beggiatoa leptomitoformis]|uniref:Phosphoglucosamine mutase n=1 Tax=Beggiatoa leptomitoformis TaxID=288004 RepID=A0A2N9YBF1_9GAMM|nr:phosphoglucosamine mutase [Beggiatoa leptomitoformis]ALG66860.1 phosphoglucosamine mutase [Beggiatoa leptomitoformis]AUI67786.1 phosphoglucosamine mutase [Beggiatoa leptomitoformis]
MKQERKYFGTDGIRGTVGEYPITPDFVLKLGWAVGRVLANGKGRNKIIIGKDTRISGYMFESALEAGLSAAGMDVGLLGPMPTPGIAYLTRTFHAQAGIVISASHNPFQDNGIKFFSSRGTKLPDDVELAIEAELDKPMRMATADKFGKAERINDARGRYIEFCKRTILYDTDLKGVKLIVDCAHGATYNIAPAVFEELGASVTSIGVQPNGLNINEGVGATQPQKLREMVLERQADLGIALDGDGDRVIMVDHRGEIVDGDELLFIIANARHQAGQLQGAVVGTLMSNFGLEKALLDKGINFHRAAVGDRYVLELLQQVGGCLGGESSGHVICLDRTTTGDGIITALQVLEISRQTGLSVHELKQGMQKLPQLMINIPIQNGPKILQLPIVKQALQSAEQQLAQQGRVLLRPSGTEPLIRVMVEGADLQQVKTVVEDLADVIRAQV